MRLLATLMLLTIVTGPQASQAEIPEKPRPFQCYNLNYRESIFKMENDILIAEDSFFATSQEQLRHAVEKRQGLPANTLYFTTIRLSIPADGLKCFNFGALPLSCEGRSENAVLSVTGSFRSTGLHPPFVTKYPFGPSRFAYTARSQATAQSRSAQAAPLSA